MYKYYRKNLPFLFLLLFGIMAFVLMRNPAGPYKYSHKNSFQPQKVNDTVNGILWETMEWEITNSGYSGNPFDIIATVVFLHKSTGEILRTEMFYDENDTWKFRFTPTRTGHWEYSTSSGDLDLNGLSGVINVTENPDTTAYGFLTNIGSKYALQVGENLYKGFLLNIYMNKTKPEYSFREGTEADFIKFAQEAKNNGCNSIYSQVVGNSWFKFPTLSYDEHSSKNPDPVTFRALELMLKAARKEKVHLHIWAWGDESRKQTQIGVGEGINGKEDRRLMRYIAARLGPLPGWSMGYGFDLHEWVAKEGPEQVRTWAGFLNSRFGWNHLLSARGQQLLLPNTINSYDGFGRAEVTLFTTTYGPQNFAEVLEDITADSIHPHLYEERHTYNRQDDPSAGTNGDWNLDMDKTRRLMWWEAMSGGMGGWIGFYETWSPAYGGHPYPNPEQLRTHRKFWIEKNRFLIDFLPDTNFTSGYGLRTKDYKRIVVYQENTSSVQINLENLPQSVKAVAVDTKKDYSEMDIGTVEPGNFIWNAPYKSDWVLALGDFSDYYYSRQAVISEEPVLELKSFSADIKNNLVILNWITAKELNVSGFEILKRTGNKTWFSVGLLKSNGNSLLNSEYQFIDEISKNDSLITYGLKALFSNGNSELVDTLQVSFENGSNSSGEIPTDYVLLQNFPNPFNAGTIIKIGLPDESRVKLTVFNNLGEEITVLVNGILSEGFHDFTFQANGLPSGVYYYRLEAEYFVEWKKMILLK